MTSPPDTCPAGFFVRECERVAKATGPSPETGIIRCAEAPDFCSGPVYENGLRLTQGFTTMNKAAFARLCGVSKAMISKYGDRIVVDEAGQVDVVGSLANLEGRLDEASRQKALTVARDAGIAPGVTPSSNGYAAPKISAKAQKDEIERDLKKLELGQKSGELVHIADVADVARQAVGAMRETFNNARRDIAKDLCVKFDLPADREAALARFLGEKFELALGRFGQVAANLAQESELPAVIAPSAANQAPLLL